MILAVSPKSLSFGGANYQSISASPALLSQDKISPTPLSTIRVEIRHYSLQYSLTKHVFFFLESSIEVFPYFQVTVVFDKTVNVLYFYNSREGRITQWRKARSIIRMMKVADAYNQTPSAEISIAESRCHNLVVMYCTKSFKRRKVVGNNLFIPPFGNEGLKCRFEKHSGKEDLAKFCSESLALQSWINIHVLNHDLVNCISSLNGELHIHVATSYTISKSSNHFHVDEMLMMKFQSGADFVALLCVYDLRFI